MSELHSRASRKRWEGIPKAERTKRMRALALKKHSQTTPEEKRRYAMKLVRARKRKQRKNKDGAAN